MRELLKAVPSLLEEQNWSSPAMLQNEHAFRFLIQDLIFVGIFAHEIHAFLGRHMDRRIEARYAHERIVASILCTETKQEATRLSREYNIRKLQDVA